MDLPLADLHVVDLTDDRGALCARILSDLGARVTRVVPDEAQLDRDDAVHRFRNANKQLLHLDLHQPVGKASFDALLSGADVLVDNLGPTVAPIHDLAAPQVQQRHPHLVHVALTDLGLSGPRAGWHLEPLPAFAASGALWASGHPTMAPCWLPGFVAHDCASVQGALGAVAAVLDRPRRGGQTVEVSAQEAALAGTNPWSISVNSYLDANPFLPADGRRNAEGTYWVLPAADGWVRVVIGHNRHWVRFVELLGSPEALTGDEWHDGMFRIQNADVIRTVAADLLTTKTRAEIFEYSMDADFPIGPVQTLSEFAGHEQTRGRGFFHDPGRGDLAAAAWQLDGRPARLPIEPSVLDAPPAAGTPAATVDTDHGPNLPLDGVRVVEFGMAAVVPELCWMLSELGAEVIKIESASHPDPLRAAGMGDPDRSFAFNAECRGRRTISIDVSTERGRDLALELCATADVVAENLRGGVLDRHGVGLDDVRAVNPDVIYVTSQGFGRTGPLSKLPAFGPVNAGFSGTHLLWNHADAPYPCGTSLNHPDHIAGKLLAVAVVAALRQRAATGAGRAIDMAQTEAAAYLIGHLFAEAAATGVDPRPAGNRSDTAVPHDVFPTAGDDRWVAVVVSDDEMWPSLERACGWEPDPDLATLAARLADRDGIDARLTAWLAERNNVAAAETLQAAGVSAMPVMGPLDHLGDPHLEARGAFDDLVHPHHGPERQVANPTRMSATPRRVATSSPRLDADTDEILADLGYGPDQIDELRASGACPRAQVV